MISSMWPSHYASYADYRHQLTVNKKKDIKQRAKAELNFYFVLIFQQRNSQFNGPLGTEVPALHPAHPPSSFSGIIEGKSGLHFKNRKSDIIPLNSNQ